MRRISALLIVIAVLSRTAEAQVVELLRKPADTTIRKLRDRMLATKDKADSAAKADTLDAITSAAYAVCSDRKNVATAERTAVDHFGSGAAHLGLQLIRLCLGDPGHFRVPLYFFVGATGRTSGSDAGNSEAFASLLDPLGGSFNASANDAYEVWPKDPLRYRHTALLVSYQMSAKYLSVHDSGNTKGLAAAVGYADFGLRYQTTAMDLDNPAKDGIAWVQVKVGASANGAGQFKEMFGSAAQNVLASFLVDAGIEIDGNLNIKASYATSLQRIPGVPRETVKFGFDVRPAKR